MFVGGLVRDDRESVYVVVKISGVRKLTLVLLACGEYRVDKLVFTGKQ